MEVPITAGRIIHVPVQVLGPLAVSEMEAVFDTGAAFVFRIVIDPSRRLLSITRP